VLRNECLGYIKSVISRSYHITSHHITTSQTNSKQLTSLLPLHKSFYPSSLFKLQSPTRYTSPRRTSSPYIRTKCLPTPQKQAAPPPSSPKIFLKNTSRPPSAAQGTSFLSHPLPLNPNPFPPSHHVAPLRRQACSMLVSEASGTDTASKKWPHHN
jgi:hypothetical protein